MTGIGNALIAVSISPSPWFKVIQLALTVTWPLGPGRDKALCPSVLVSDS